MFGWDRSVLLKRMMSIVRISLIAPVTFLCVGLAAAANQQSIEARTGKQLLDPASVQGCYELGTLKWSPDLLRFNEDQVFITPPRRIQILTEHGSAGLEEHGYLVRPAPGIPASVQRFTFWMPTGPNTIEIVFSTGTSGLSMTLKRDGTTLRGKAKTHWDFRRRGQRAKILAPKVDCGSVP